MGFGAIRVGHFQAGFTNSDGVAVVDRAFGIGLLSPLGGGEVGGALTNFFVVHIGAVQTPEVADTGLGGLAEGVDVHQAVVAGDGAVLVVVGELGATAVAASDEGGGAITKSIGGALTRTSGNN